MKTVIFVVGLPGSGKTYWANQQNDGYVLDDPTDLNKIAKIINQYNKVYITDPHLVLESNRINAQKFVENMGVKNIQWVFFENNPEACWENVLRRNDGREVKGMIFTYSTLYRTPINIIKVYKEEKK